MMKTQKNTKHPIRLVHLGPACHQDGDVCVRNNNNINNNSNNNNSNNNKNNNNSNNNNNNNNINKNNDNNKDSNNNKNSNNNHNNNKNNNDNDNNNNNNNNDNILFAISTWAFLLATKLEMYESSSALGRRKSSCLQEELF